MDRGVGFAGAGAGDAEDQPRKPKPISRRATGFFKAAELHVRDADSDEDDAADQGDLARAGDGGAADADGSEDGAAEGAAGGAAAAGPVGAVLATESPIRATVAPVVVGDEEGEAAAGGDDDGDDDDDEAVDEWEDDFDLGFRDVAMTPDEIAALEHELLRREGTGSAREVEDDEDDDGTTPTTEADLAKDIKSAQGWTPPTFDNQLAESRAVQEAKAIANANATKFEVMHLKIIYEPNHTGFEETKEYQIRINDVIAGRYQIVEYIGSAAFSRAVQCLDLETGQLVCLKIIRNHSKDYVDQGLDEIKVLRLINVNDPDDKNHCLRLYDSFYFREHLIIVTELLRDNLYEFSKYNRQSGAEPYFTVPRLQKVTKQVLEGLRFIHSLSLIHCDLKPENILISSYSRCEVKIIDFGSSCFLRDHLSSYVQSRSYRAPEVVLGCPYDGRIDLWSLGCILSELHTGNVMFQNDASVHGLLARIIGMFGPLDPRMIKSGRHSHRFVTPDGYVYRRNRSSYIALHPKSTTLKNRLRTTDPLFLSFVASLLQPNPAKRPTAAEALRHPWLQKEY